MAAGDQPIAEADDEDGGGGAAGGGGYESESNYLQFLVFHYDMAVISVVQTNNRLWQETIINALRQWMTNDRVATK